MVPMEQIQAAGARGKESGTGVQSSSSSKRMRGTDTSWALLVPVPDGTCSKFPAGKEPAVTGKASAGISPWMQDLAWRYPAKELLFPSAA